MARTLLILLAVTMLSVVTSGQSTIDLDNGLRETVIPLGSSLYLSLETNQVDQIGHRVGGGYDWQADNVALYNMAQAPTLNTSATWEDAPRNMLVSSEDLTSTWAETGSGTINDATHFTFAAQNDAIHQTYRVFNYLKATLYVRARVVSGNTDLHLYHSGLTPASTAITVTGSLADYAVTITGDNGDVLFGLQDQNAAGFGQIEVTRWALILGELSASEAAAAYEGVGANRQVVNDWSGSGYHGCLGATCGASSDDPVYTTLYSRNIAGAAWADDLTTGWAFSNASAADSDTITVTSSAGYARSPSMGVTANSVYTISFYAKASTLSATRMRAWDVTNSSYLSEFLEYTPGTTEWSRVTGSFTTGATTASAFIYIVVSPGSTGTIDITDFQIERTRYTDDGPSGFVHPNSPKMTGVLMSGDLISSSTFPTLSSDWGVFFLVNPLDVSDRGLLRGDSGEPIISIDSDGKVVYTGGSAVTSTLPLQLGLWQLVGVQKSGTTITHYLNGVANGSGTSSTGNTISEINFGSDGVATGYGGRAVIIGLFNESQSTGEVGQMCADMQDAFEADAWGARLECWNELAQFDVSEWYVASDGNDLNHGHTSDKPKATFASFQTYLQDGDTVYLAKGDTFREELVKPSAADNISILAYGTGARPIITGADAIATGDWSKTGGQTNVYEIAVTVAAEDNGNFVKLWEDGDFLTRVADVATCDSTAGSYYPTAEEGSITIYAHTSGSDDPAGNGSAYEYSKRRTAIYAGGPANTGVTVSGINTRAEVGGLGSLYVGLDSTVSDCLVEDGGKHNLLIGSGTVSNTTISGFYRGSGETVVPLDYYIAEPSGATLAFTDVTVTNGDGPRITGTGIAGHATGGASTQYSQISCTRCTVDDVSTGIGLAVADLVTVTDPDVSNTGVALRFIATETQVSGGTLVGDMAVHALLEGTVATITNTELEAEDTGSDGIYENEDGYAATVTFSGVTFRGPAADDTLFGIYSLDADSVFTVSGSTFTAVDRVYSLPATYSMTSDGNIFSAVETPDDGFDFGGLTGKSITEWYCATGQDANSTPTPGACS